MDTQPERILKSKSLNPMSDLRSKVGRKASDKDYNKIVTKKRLAIIANPEIATLGYVEQKQGALENLFSNFAPTIEKLEFSESIAKLDYFFSKELSLILDQILGAINQKVISIEHTEYFDTWLKSVQCFCIRIFNSPLVFEKI
jgi:hypothetical protein